MTYCDDCHQKIDTSCGSCHCHGDCYACPESQGGCPRPQDKWYVVACRLAFDEEDSYYDFHAASEAKAVRMAERQIREDADEQHDEEDGGRDFFVICVISTTDKPTVSRPGAGSTGGTGKESVDETD